MIRPTIVVICGDPGGGNAVAPVIEALRHDGCTDVAAIAYRQTADIWKRRALSFTPINESTSEGQAITFIRDHHARLVLTGTSVNSVDLEKKFISAACRAGVPSLAVMDFWSNYRARFSDKEDKLVYLPDRIAVMDERACDEMIAEGFDSRLLVVTGQPALEDLAKWRDRFTSGCKTEIRTKLGLGHNDLMVLFASQPLSGMGNSESGTPNIRGFTEKTVIPALAISLKRIGERLGKRIVLVIRPHPRENPEVFKGMNLGGIPMIVATDGESYDLAMSADVVSGMNSILLMESCYLGCVTVSIQPGLCGLDKLPSNQMGMSIPVYQEQEIEPVFERLLCRNNPLGAEKREYVNRSKGSARRVVSLIYDMLGLYG